MVLLVKSVAFFGIATVACTVLDVAGVPGLLRPGFACAFVTLILLFILMGIKLGRGQRFFE